MDSVPPAIVWVRPAAGPKLPAWGSEGVKVEVEAAAKGREEEEGEEGEMTSGQRW